jgi:hypothetical protein
MFSLWKQRKQYVKLYLFTIFIYYIYTSCLLTINLLYSGPRKRSAWRRLAYERRTILNQCLTFACDLSVRRHTAWGHKQAWNLKQIYFSP